MTKLRQFDWSNFRFFFSEKKNYRLIFLSSSLHFRLGLPFWWSVFSSCSSHIMVHHVCLPLLSFMFVSHFCLPLLAFMLLIRFSTPRVLLMLAFHFCHPFVSVIFPIHVRLFGLSTMLCLLSHSSFQPIVRTTTHMYFNTYQPANLDDTTSDGCLRMSSTLPQVPTRQLFWFSSVDTNRRPFNLMSDTPATVPIRQLRKPLEKLFILFVKMFLYFPLLERFGNRFALA